MLTLIFLPQRLYIGIDTFIPKHELSERTQLNNIFSYWQISTMSGMRGGGGGKLEDLMMAYADLKAPSKSSGF